MIFDDYISTYHQKNTFSVNSDFLRAIKTLNFPSVRKPFEYLSDQNKINTITNRFDWYLKDDMIRKNKAFVVIRDTWGWFHINFRNCIIEKLFNIGINVLRNLLLNKSFSLLFYHAGSLKKLFKWRSKKRLFEKCKWRQSKKRYLLKTILYSYIPL